MDGPCESLPFAEDQPSEAREAPRAERPRGRQCEEYLVRWSVGIEAEGDQVLSREEVVELADAVAASGGIASGIGSKRYGATLMVQAGSRDEAVGEHEAVDGTE